MSWFTSIAHNPFDVFDLAPAKTSNWAPVRYQYYQEIDTLVVSFIGKRGLVESSSGNQVYPGLTLNYTAAGKVAALNIQSAALKIKLTPSPTPEGQNALTISQVYNPFDDKLSVFFTASPIKPVMEKKTDDDRVRVLEVAGGALMGLVMDKASAEVASEE